MAAHRYWRLHCTRNGGNLYVALTELTLATSIGGASVATGGTASSYSNYSGWTPDLAFNGSTAEPGWHSGTGDFPTTPQWLQYDFGAGNDVDIVEFGITSRSNASDAATQTPQDFLLQYSDNGSDFTTLFAVAGEGGWTATETRKYSASTAAKKIWKIDISAVQSGLAYINEIEMRLSPAGADQCTGGAAAASSYYGGSDNYAPYRAFGDTAGDWVSNANPPQWIQYSFAAAKDIKSYMVKASASVPAGAPKTWTLSYNDGIGGWTVADTQTDAANWSADEERIFTFAAAGGNTSRTLLGVGG